MLSFFKRLFSKGITSRLVIDAYWCGTNIKLPTKIETPLGSNVTVVKVCVEIHYSIEGNQIHLQRVKMATGGGSIMGASTPVNIASDRTGEAWHISHFHSDQILVEAIENELSFNDSGLRRMMFGKWRDANRGTLTKSLVAALNSHAVPSQIAELIAESGRKNEIVFTYTKPSGESDIRHVTVKGVSGDSIRAVDHKDEKTKSFRIDRITNAKSA